MPYPVKTKTSKRYVPARALISLCTTFAILSQHRFLDPLKVRFQRVFRPVILAVLIISLAAIGGLSTANAVTKNDRMSLQQAREYLLALINMDRRRSGLRPVGLDSIATKAGQLHTAKLLSVGAHGHFQPNGTKPPQRYNLAGGTDYVAENAYCIGNCDRRHKVDPNATFTRDSITVLEEGWMKSPLHRQNILDKDHTHVGIGLSKSNDGITISAVQEFINKYGNIGRIPDRAYRGNRVPISGSLIPGYKIRSIDVFREPFPQRMSVDACNSKYSYDLPNARVVTYFPDKMAISPNGFGVSIDVRSEWQTGLYYAFIWAENTRTQEAIPISMLTFYVL